LDWRIGSAVLFYCFAALVTYLYFFLLFYVAGSAVMGLLLTISVLVLLALCSYILVTRVSKKRWSPDLLGLRRGELGQSFLLASVPSIFGPLVQLYVIKTSSIDVLT
jgi:hypothetical protein